MLITKKERFNISKISISADKWVRNSEKKVVIDGVDFKVKKPGAGHQLDAMSVFREVGNAKDDEFSRNRRRKAWKYL